MRQTQQKRNAVRGGFYGEIALGIFEQGPKDEEYEVRQEQQIRSQTDAPVEIVNTMEIVFHIVDVVSYRKPGPD